MFLQQHCPLNFIYTPPPSPPTSQRLSVISQNINNAARRTLLCCVTRLHLLILGTIYSVACTFNLLRILLALWLCCDLDKYCYDIARKVNMPVSWNVSFCCLVGTEICFYLIFSAFLLLYLSHFQMDSLKHSCLMFSLSVRFRVSHPYKRKGKIIDVYFYLYGYVYL